MALIRIGAEWLLIASFVGCLLALQNKQSIEESIKDLNATVSKVDGSLQLNLKWKARLNNGTNLDIIVIPKGEGCSSIPCIEYGLSGTINEAAFPKDRSQIIEHGECVIEPGCLYLTRVMTTNRKTQTNTTVVIPGDCYLGICSCRHARNLPVPMISANVINTNHLNISWTLKPVNRTLVAKNISLHSVFISVSQGNTPSLSWGGKQSTIYRNFHALDGNSYVDSAISIFNFNLSTKVVPGTHFKIRAHVVDGRGCEGREISYNLPIPGIKNESRLSTEASNTHIFTLIIPLTIAILILVTIGNYVYKHTCKVKPSAHWQSIYRNATPTTGINQISMEENLLYMDKDILDAQEKGKADIFEVPPSCVMIGKEIGKGAFGRVFKGTAQNLLRVPGTTTVAVKMLKEKSTSDTVEDFLAEIQTMKDVGRHENIVALLGCCTIKEPLKMIMEFVAHGSLLKYLQIVREKHLETLRMQLNAINLHSERPIFNAQPPRGKYLELKHSMSTASSDASYIKQPETPATRPSVTETMYTMLSQTSNESSQSQESPLEYVVDNNELHNFALQIAKGMRHMEDKGITHRDLAARNILIGARKTLKISDFGLSRAGIYVNTKTKKLPLRWLSIEAIRDHLYSSSSDVWAFGVVLWEIGTLGGFPYPSVNNHDILPYLAQGKRLNRPEICSEDLYALMLQCWQEDPIARPTFADIVKLLQPKNQKVYVDFSTLGSDYVFPPTREQVLDKLINTPDVPKHGK